MLIDWFTVAAQILNFLVLVWLLKRFLYNPILNAVDAREEHIETQIKQADELKQQAEEARTTFESKAMAFDTSQQQRLDALDKDIEQQRQDRLNTVREEAQQLEEKLKQGRDNQQRSLSKQLTIDIQNEVFAIAEKTLMDLADTSLQDKMTTQFIKQLQAYNNSELVEFNQSLAISNEPLMVHSAMPLSESQCQDIEQAVKGIFELNKPIAFLIKPELIAGIALFSDGQKIAWSINDYLKSLSDSIANSFQSANKPQQNVPKQDEG
ncbi:hypothetical protein LCGC14_1014560 [marine sediment metagenome]|uniref:Uncharacterized protein n=1 Tax=marine sediment metagenome TaxID=412755 RepID=A0A0F9MZ90_9ZZZZ